MEGWTREPEDRGRKVELEEARQSNHKVGQSNQKKGGWMVEPEGKRLDSWVRRTLDG
jgi:hypothetical protein